RDVAARRADSQCPGMFGHFMFPLLGKSHRGDPNTLRTSCQARVKRNATVLANWRLATVLQTFGQPSSPA
ncbi:MAG: hypothetical protein ACYS1E_19330, partial [Planctomycetota bacterium]